MSSFLTAFCNLIIRFNEELIDTFPNEQEFKTVKTAIMLMKQTNPRLLLNLFVSYIEPWKEYVTNRNESFFINKDYDDEAQGDTNFLMLITRLKQYWPNLSDKNRDCIWKYLNTLIILSEKC